MEKFKESANWITIVFLAVLYTAMGMMEIQNGSVSLKDFSDYTWLDWTLWAVFTFVPAIMALVVSSSFKKEGIKQAEKEIKAEIDEYRKYLHVDITKVVRSKKEFLTQGAMKEGAQKFVMALVLSFVAGQMFVDISTDGVVKIIINLAMWGVFGVISFNKSHDYGIDELKEWYIIEAAKLKKLDEEEKEARKKELEAAVKKQKEEDENEMIRLKKDLKLWREVTRYVTGKIPEL